MQNRDKQIEGIVKDFCPLYQEYGSCKRCNKDLDIDDEPCYYGCVANLIIDYDYRKSTELAEEIFAEIEALMYSKCFSIRADRDVTGLIIDGEQFAELKKKYTKSEKDNG